MASSVASFVTSSPPFVSLLHDTTVIHSSAEYMDKRQSLTFILKRLKIIQRYRKTLVLFSFIRTFACKIR